MGGRWLAEFAIIITALNLSTLSTKSSKVSTQTTSKVGDTGMMNLTRRTSLAYHEVRLQCSPANPTNGNITQGNLTWIFVPCWPEKECLKKVSWSGNEVCGGPSQSGCGHVLILARPTRSSQGLYTCYRVHGSRGFFINTPIASYLLQIIEGDGGGNEAIVESPKEVKVRAPLEVVLRCQVTLPTKTAASKSPNSPSPATFKVHWFKLITGQQALRPQPTQIRYMDQLYQLLNSTTLFRSTTNNNVFQSRLTIKKSSVVDSGLYVCGVLTEAGIRYAQTTLTVLTEDADDHQETVPVDKEGSIQKNSLWEVFGSVVVFVLCVVFACCWTLGICYYKMFQQAFKQPNTSVAPDLDQSTGEPEHATHLARPREIHMDIIGSETSDYEHIVTL